MTTTAVRPAGVVDFIRRRPLTSFFLWLFTVGQAFAFAPVVVLWTTGVEVPYWQLFILGSTLVGMLLPAVVITRIVDGPGAVRELWRRAFAVRVPLRWYALTLATPLVDMVKPMRYPEIYPPEDESTMDSLIGAVKILSHVP